MSGASSSGVRVGVVGATGLVGTEMLRLLEERSFPVDELRVYASPRSEGRKLAFAGGEVVCEVLRDDCFDGLDFVVIDVDDDLALEWAPRAADSGARVVDNSAAFRMDDDVPLVVAEVNPDDVRFLPRGIVSCPNCTTMVPLTALGPAPPGGGDRADGGVHLPVGVGRGHARAPRARRAVDQGRGASRAVEPGRCAGRDRARRGVGPPDRRQRDPARRLDERGRLHVGRVEVHAGEPQDPPRARAARQHHLRAGSGVRRARGRAQRGVLARAAARRGRRAARSGTGCAPRRRRRRAPHSARGRGDRSRCSSGGCASTRRRNARSTSGSPATTCARAPRSTPSSSRS